MQNYNNEPRRGLLTGRRLAASVRSPRKVRRSHGSRTSAYTPFGAPVGNAALARRFMFSSEEWFPVRSTLNYDLLLYLYRAYSPALARFLTRDPIAENGGPNLYNFVGNNPVTKWDALGFQYATYSIPRVTGDFNADLTGHYASKYVPDDKVDTQKGCCGLDVTEKLNHLFEAVKTRLFDSETLWSGSLYGISDAWDIEEFFAAGTDTTGRDIFKGSGRKNCYQTVTYNGHCYKVTSLNYMLWGYLGAMKEDYVQKRYGISSDHISRHLIVAAAYNAILRPLTLLFADSKENENLLAQSTGRMAMATAGAIYYKTSAFTPPYDVDYDATCNPSDKPYSGAITAKVVDIKVKI